MASFSRLFLAMAIALSTVLPACRALEINGVELLMNEPEDSNEPANLPAGAIRQTGPDAGGMAHMAISRDGSRIAVAGKDGKVRLWKGKSVKVIPAHVATCNNVSFTVDGKSFLSCAVDGTVTQFDSDTGEEIQKFVGSAGEVKSVVCSPDGVHAASGDTEGIRIWNIKTGKQERLLVGHKVPEIQGEVVAALTIDAMAYSPDGRMLVSEANDETARLWDVVTGKEVKELTEHDGLVAAVNLSPDGRWGISTRQGGRFRLWDAHTGEMKKVVMAHIRDVSCTSFSLDGRYVLTGGQDRTLRQWDIESGLEIRRFQLSSIPVNVAYAPNGITVYTLSPREGIVEWNLNGAPIMPNLTEVKTPDEAWKNLGALDYETRSAGFIFFAKNDPDAVKHLSEHLQEGISESSRAEQRAAIARLDDESYSVRMTALHDLKQLGSAAREELIVAADNPTATTESRLQTQALLKAIGGRTDVRRILALEILGVLGTPDAKAELQKLAVLSGTEREASFQARDILARLPR